MEFELSLGGVSRGEGGWAGVGRGLRESRGVLGWPKLHLAGASSLGSGTATWRAQPGSGGAANPKGREETWRGRPLCFLFLCDFFRCNSLLCQ